MIATATYPETGCNTESILEVTVGTGGINENLASKVRIFPNPAKDILYIESELPFTSIEIFNQSGQKLLHSENLTTDISGLPGGTYLVKVFDKKRELIKTEKLVISKQ